MSAFTPHRASGSCPVPFRYIYLVWLMPLTYVCFMLAIKIIVELTTWDIPHVNLAGFVPLFHASPTPIHLFLSECFFVFTSFSLSLSIFRSTSFLFWKKIHIK